MGTVVGVAGAGPAKLGAGDGELVRGDDGVGVGLDVGLLVGVGVGIRVGDGVGAGEMKLES